MPDLDQLFARFQLEVSTTIKAPQDDVWTAITDVTRMPEFSPELIRSQWSEGSPRKPVAGARFCGTNQLGNFRWTRECTVVDAVPPELFAYVVGDRFDGSPSAKWVFEVVPSDDATILRQRFVHVPEGRSGTRLLANQDPERAEQIIDIRRRQLERGMFATLEAIREALERE